MTNQDAINRALSKLSIIEAGDSASATDSALGLTALNEMMAEWKERDMDFNWFAQDTLTADLPVPAWAVKGIVSNLAMYLTTDYRVPLTRELAAEATAGLNTIATSLMNLRLRGVDLTYMPLGSGRYTRYQIDSDTF